TTFEPGARLVLTHGGERRPRSTARFAARAAATITEGFDVLVQLVIAAITTEPCRSLCSAPSSVRFTWLRRAGGASVATATLPPSSSQRRAFGVAGGATGEVAFMSVGSASRKFFFTSRSGT